jgi:RNAse (barnase) inhibitor barstar
MTQQQETAEPNLSLDERFDRALEIAEREGLSLDAIWPVLRDCPQSTFAALADNPSRLPR